MATKLALLSFKFDRIDDITYDPALDYNFLKQITLPGEALQPVVAEATARIKRSLGDSVSSWFKFGHVSIHNISNFIHIATLAFNSETQLNDGSETQCSILAVIKFYRLEPEITYQVTLDVEEMPSAANEPESKRAYEFGMTNKDIEKLGELLNDEFKLDGKIEIIPLIKRGRTDKPHYLVSSDDRMMEYDFDGVLFHEKSEFQDIKVVSSPSLGNTLLLNNLQNLAEVDLDYTYALMDKGNVSYANKEILILGGGDGGLLWELLKEKPKFVTMAEIDPVVIEACRQHLRPCGECLNNLKGANYEIIVDDCMKVLRQAIETGKRYDVIFNDLTDIPVTKRAESLTAFDSSAIQRDNPWHFIEVIFNLALDCLDERHGLFMNHATGKGNTRSLQAYEEFLKNLRRPVEFSSRTSYVPSFMEIWVFYTIKKRGTRKDGNDNQKPVD